MANKTNPIQLETTPRVYYEHYMTVVPSYDLYPSLCRRLANGYVHSPKKPTRSKNQQTNFISMNSATTSRRFYNESEDPLWRPIPPQQEETTPDWDLYPSLLRHVENYGTDQMRQRLHVIENTIALH